jgi:putative tryptophan/tyrosine transport system substrate-binding protein
MNRRTFFRVPPRFLTGVLIAPGHSLVGKKLELLQEVVPRAVRIGFLSPDNSGAQGQVPEAQKTAASLNLKLVVVEVQDGNYDRAFNTMVAERPSALFVANCPTFMRDRKRIIDRVAKHRLPAIYEWAEQVEDGGLMSYGSSSTWGFSARGGLRRSHLQRRQACRSTHRAAQ